MAIYDGEQAFPAFSANAGTLINVFRGERTFPIFDASEGTTVMVYVGEQTPTYPAGYIDGEIFGFSSPKDTEAGPISPGETDPDKKVVDFYIYTTTGLPANGALGEGAVLVPSTGDVQVNRDLAGYVNATGTFIQLSDHKYRYTFSDSEIAGAAEGSAWVRIKRTGYRTTIKRVPLRFEAPSLTTIRDAILDAARTGHITAGTIGEGVSVAVALLQGNIYIDQITNTANGQTAARLRCFHTGVATSAATANGSGEGEFATFIITTTYTSPNKIVTHRVVQQ